MYQGATGRIRSLLAVFPKLVEEELVLFIDDDYLALLGSLPAKIQRKTMADAWAVTSVTSVTSETPDMQPQPQDEALDAAEA